ncbi:hypothetical protein [Patulibacter sp. SYSU D01012]|uniref:hypothetical protein n=1 Tax=Patulibacter sp. SYSU D01012 TaxID=2817381 RepID=UPI001B302A0C|nr:hypothetical protein [Patulibacter sp. SYSU D01012]
MILISVLSTVAVVFGLGANLPQISRMARSRTAAGQSPIGWAMGALTNLCLAYVNLVGLGAMVLGVANLVTVVLCSVAISLILRYGGEAPAEAARPAAPGHDTLVEMPTQELMLLREAVDAAERRRAEWRAAQALAEGRDPEQALVAA